MKLKNSFFYTIREDIKDEESISGNLLVKSGMFKKLSNGIYMKMPLGDKVVKNVINIVRKYMNEAGALELSMPLLLPTEVFSESGRESIFGNSMFRLNDRYNRSYALGPTHEEFFVIASQMGIKSYKDMPFTLYQIGNKYRDEIRPRLGLIRVREFIMKDAYSFDIDNESLDKSYQKIYSAYHKIFTELGLKYTVVTADTGAMGGLLSEEFQALTDVGEDTLVVCEKCGYSSNIEVSKCVINKKQTKEVRLSKEKIYTPNVGTIEDVARFLDKDAQKFVKTMIYKANEQFYACMVQGNKEINEIKLAKILNATEVMLALVSDVEKITNAKVGFAGPININIPIIMDQDIEYMSNFIVGSNETDYHYINVNITDFKPTIIADIKNVLIGDLCPTCYNPLIFKKGIEIGNTFKLGTKYSESLNLKYLDKFNTLKPVVMGCYGIGIERIIASIVEQNHDEKGIIWPHNIAPFKVGIIIISNDELSLLKANQLYDKLNKLKIDTLLDDRDERPGVKFNDMDLIGIPYRITIGKKISENLVEFKKRTETDFKLINIDEVIELIK
ncbi:MAG: proline--tRNA ligase [Bacilli bacterium]